MTSSIGSESKPGQAVRSTGLGDRALPKRVRTKTGRGPVRGGPTLEVAVNGGPAVLRLTGPEGVKQFIAAQFLTP